MTNEEFMEQKDEILALASVLLEAEGATRELNIIRNYKSNMWHVVDSDAAYYALSFEVPYHEYKLMKKELKIIERTIHDAVAMMVNEQWHKIGLVKLMPTMDVTSSSSSSSTEPADNLDRVTSINNQGRVRSDNPAAIECDGLHFRSQPEINLYKALKALGLVFAPLPVFLKGGRNYARYEPDFFIIKDGITTIIEIDGHVVHSGRKANDQRKTMMFEREGTNVIRIMANDCFTEEGAMRQARDVLHRLSQRIIV